MFFYGFWYKLFNNLDSSRSASLPVFALPRGLSRNSNPRHTDLESIEYHWRLLFKLSCYKSWPWNKFKTVPDYCMPLLSFEIFRSIIKQKIACQQSMPKDVLVWTAEQWERGRNVWTLCYFPFSNCIVVFNDRTRSSLFQRDAEQMKTASFTLSGASKLYTGHAWYFIKINHSGNSVQVSVPLMAFAHFSSSVHCFNCLLLQYFLSLFLANLIYFQYWIFAVFILFSTLPHSLCWCVFLCLALLNIWLLSILSWKWYRVSCTGN